MIQRFIGNCPTKVGPTRSQRPAALHDRRIFALRTEPMEGTGGRKFWWLLGLALAALFGTALLFRATSLNTSPFPSGDEYFLSTQGYRFVRGEPSTWVTPSGKLVSPPF